jgi:predicted nucleic acid-binding protein
VSDVVLNEIAELHLNLPVRAGITAEDTDDLIQLILSFATALDQIPEVYFHPIDPDDSAYVNLALAAHAELIISRDKHLLGLRDVAKPWSKDFRDRFPQLRVLGPDEYLAECAKDASAS